MSKPVLYLFNGKVARFGSGVLGFTPPPTYTVTLDTVTHGSITASPMYGIAGTTITLTSSPDTGYELDYFTVNGVAIVGNSFTMPAENVTVGAVLVEDPMGPVQIGTQIWSSKNLSIDDGGEGIYTRTVNYGQGDVVETYYTFAAAVRVAASVTGWHLPTKDEWDALASYIGSNGGQKLKSTYGWSSNRNGTDEFGFTGLPAGRYDDTTGYYAYFWSSTAKPGTTDAYCGYLSTSNGFSVSSVDKTRGYSVRLIKDS